MIRILFFVLILAGATSAAAWLSEQPGNIMLTWHGMQYTTSVGVGLAVLLLLAVSASVVFGLLRFIFKVPSLMSLASRARRREKGILALSRGMVAAGAGDAKRARQAALEVKKLLPNEPLTQLLSAQSAQLSGDRSGAKAAFTQMLARPETRLLGLRGLHVEARRRGDMAAATEFAQSAHKIAALPWAAQAVLEHQTNAADWQAALTTVDNNASAGTITRQFANRQRAVLQTAIAMDASKADPDGALQCALAALKLAPGLVPAAVLAGRLLARKNDLRRASKVLMAAWVEEPHPDIARAYLDVRHGDSVSDRLARAELLVKSRPHHSESLLMMARAAIDAHEFGTARSALDDLAHQDGAAPPTVRFCLLMAELEEKQNGAVGKVREWLARASRARRNPTWIADGVMSDTWAPVSPVTGALDAYVWQTPVEHLAAPLTAAQPGWDAAGTPQIATPAVMQIAATQEAQPPALTGPPLPTKSVTADNSAAPGPSNVSVLLRQSNVPVVFPHPAAPDDPGEEALESVPVPRRFGFPSRS